jgi:8-oxo-dGTP pyrophosphatase MutT (NUDIX family)
MPATVPIANFLAAIWNGLAAPVRRRFSWLIHAKFVHGVSGIIIDDHRRVLLLKHRFWLNQCWGLPSGMALQGETLAQTLARELLEEVALPINPRKLLRISTSHQLHSQFFLLADSTGLPRLNSLEIIDARFYDSTALPDNLLESHRLLLTEYFSNPDLPGIPLE